MEQPELFHESLNEALVAVVAGLGGKKIVASTLWPEKPADEAARHLADCLNPDRAARLDPEKLLLLLKLARAKGLHLAIAWMLEDIGYAPPVPIEPEDEHAELMRQELLILERLELLMKRRDRLRLKVAI
jgi:hypothetical protein